MLIPRDLRLQCRGRWLVLVAVGVGCFDLCLAQPVKAHLLHVLKGLARTLQVDAGKSGMALFSTQMPFSGRPWSRSTWVNVENMPLQVLGMPRVPPGVGSWPGGSRRDDIHERAVVCRRASTASFFMLLPKALTNLSGADASDLSGWLMKGLRQVSGRTPKRDCAATQKSPFGDDLDRKGVPSPNELFKNHRWPRTPKRWSSRGGYRRIPRGPWRGGS